MYIDMVDCIIVYCKSYDSMKLVEIPLGYSLIAH